MRNTYRIALAVMSLLAGVGGSSGMALAQETVSQENVSQGTVAQNAGAEKVTTTLKKNCLVFAVEGATTTVTADRITRHGNNYTLSGNFRMTSPTGVKYEGKDAEVALYDPVPGDSSGSRMVSLTIRERVTVTDARESTRDKPAVARTLVTGSKAQMTLLLPLQP